MANQKQQRMVGGQPQWALVGVVIVIALIAVYSAYAINRRSTTIEMGLQQLTAQVDSLQSEVQRLDSALSEIQRLDSALSHIDTVGLKGIYGRLDSMEKKRKEEDIKLEGRIHHKNNSVSLF